MTSVFGRLLQASALVLLPFALVQGLVTGDVRGEVKLLALGGFLFILGRILSREK